MTFLAPSILLALPLIAPAVIGACSASGKASP